MKRFLVDRPWLLVVAAFVVLISGWVFLLKLANDHRPESVQIETALPHDSH